MRPELEEIAELQCGVFTRAQAIAAGYTRLEIDSRLTEKTWSSVARGIYAPADVSAAQSGAAGGSYVLVCAARRLRVTGPSVISHESAALLHGIPLLDRVIGPVRLTLPPDRAATRGQLPGRFLAELPAGHITTIGLPPLTSPARTVVDLARSLDLDAAMMTADGALRLGLDRRLLIDVITACRRWPGIEQAQQVVMMATPWTESALESLAMLWFRRQGLPLPQQQLTVRTAHGRWLARVDFVWPEHRTVCEVDGQKKYVDSSPTQLDRRARALWREKLREDAVRDSGLEVVRGYWSDRGDDGAELAARLRRAFARGAAATLPGTYRICDERSHARSGPLAA